MAICKQITWESLHAYKKPGKKYGDAMDVLFGEVLLVFSKH